MMSGQTTAQKISALDADMKRLKMLYEHYFIGMEPREPVPQLQAFERDIRSLRGIHIGNTADRFKLNGLNQRFQTYRRQWDETLRKMEAGTYKRHLFKADLRQKASADLPPGARPSPAAARQSSGEALFSDYLSAAQQCGQSTNGLTPEKLERVIKKQEAAIKASHGVDKVKFRVDVQNGKVKLKATAVRGG